MGAHAADAIEPSRSTVGGAASTLCRERVVEIVGAARRIENGERRLFEAREPLGALEHRVRRRGV